MKKIFVSMLVVFVLICFGAVSFAQGKKVVRERVTTKTAIVTAIDLPNRLVTIKDKDGNITDIRVSREVKNLSKVVVGDQIKVKFYESLAVKMAKPGSSPSISKGQSKVESKPGEKPGGVAANVVIVVATIVEIDPDKTYVKLKGPEGKMAYLLVENPENLENVKVGDQLEVAYTESLAVSVSTVKKSGKK